MAKTCGHCGEQSVEVSGGQNVCTACGIVASEFIVEDAPFDAGSTFISNAPSHIHSSTRQLLDAGGLPNQCIFKQVGKIPQWKTLGTNKITQLCSVLSLGPDVKQLAVRYYDDLCGNVERSIKWRQVPKKEAFCCACIYIACREYELPVTMGYISSASEYSVDVCFSAVKEAASILHIQLKPQSADSLIEAVLNQDLHPSIKLTANAKSLTKQVIELMADLFLSQGRRPNALIAAVFYYVYKSEDFCKRRTLSLSKVVKNSRAVAKTKLVIKPALFELLKSIPWLSESDQTEEMIPYYLKDIVQFKKVLIREALTRKSSESVEHDDGSGGETTLKEEQTQNLPLHERSNSSSENQSPIRPMKQETEGSARNARDNKKEIRTISKNDKANTTKRDHSAGTGEDIESSVNSKDPNSDSPISKSPSLETTDSVFDSSSAPEVNTLFYPPAYKRARKRSEEREEIQAYIDQGRAALEKLAEKFE